MSAIARSVGRLSPSTSALFVCDIQDRFRNVIHGFPAVVDTAQRMVTARERLHEQHAGRAHKGGPALGVRACVTSVCVTARSLYSGSHGRSLAK